MLKILFRILSVNVLVLIIKAVSGILLPRFMSTQAYAQYQTFNLYLSYLPILTLGFPTGMFVNYGGRSIDSLDKARYKSELILLFCILAAFTALLAAAWLLRPDGMLLCVTLSVVPYCLVCSFQSLYQAWGEFRKYNRSLLITAAAPVIGALVLLVTVKRLEAMWLIALYVAAYWAMTVSVILQSIRVIRGSATIPVLDERNRETWKTGAAICIGSYIYVLLHSVDKQFVKFFFDTTDFAQYSFALSLQSLVMVFITALSQPMYHFTAKGQVPESRYGEAMRILLMVGAFGGVAYHACRFGVAWLLPAYMDSLDIVGVYFLVFPPLAVIQCLFINLYKLRRLKKAYLIRLAGMLALSAIMNLCLIRLERDPVSVAAATVIVYYLWLLADTRVFREIGFSYKDLLFLVGYGAIYMFSRHISGAIVAGVVYVVLLSLLCVTVYAREVAAAVKFIARKEFNQ